MLNVTSYIRSCPYAINGSSMQKSMSRYACKNRWLLLFAYIGAAAGQPFDIKQTHQQKNPLILEGRDVKAPICSGSTVHRHSILQSFQEFKRKIHREKTNAWKKSRSSDGEVGSVTNVNQLSLSVHNITVCLPPRFAGGFGSLLPQLRYWLAEDAEKVRHLFYLVKKVQTEVAHWGSQSLCAMLFFSSLQQGIRYESVLPLDHWSACTCFIVSSGLHNEPWEIASFLPHSLFLLSLLFLSLAFSYVGETAVH